MAKLIDEYFSKHLEIPWDEAVKLHKEYYTNYGLAIEGLVRHHQIDPLDYNAKVDDALPLEGIIKPNPELRELLDDIDKDKVTVWLFTNAYVNHGKRVVKLLGIEDIFDGLTYCNYAEQPLLCKPDPRMYEKAMREAGIERVEDCFFVGKSCLFALWWGLSNSYRRFRIELHKGKGIWLDSSPSCRRRSACS
jgi:pyrimidine and pyridine-specific 5'-nucleotidase